MGPRHTPEQASSSKTNPLRLSTLGRNFLGDQIAKSHDESEVSLEYNEKFLSSSSDISPQSLLTLGRQCAQLFFQLCNRPESKVKGLEELQNNLDRFKIWAGNIGLFAPGLAGIDYRFAQDDDGRDVLESMLSKLKVRLEALLLLETVQPKSKEIISGPGKSAPQALLSTLDSSVRRLEAKSFDLLVASSSEESSIAEESTSGESNHAAADESDPATRGIDEIITQLYRFLVFVKKPTSNREYAEVIAFKNRQLEAGNHEDIESYVRWYIARHLPLASPTIAERLATAAIYRNWKILYKNKHAEKLKHDSESWFIPRNPQSVLEQPMLPHIVKAPQILQQMPTIIEPTEDDTKKRVNFVPMSVTEASTIRKLLVPAAPKSSFSAITHSAVIRRGKLDVPSAPEMEEMAKETVCPYCCQVVGPELLGKGSTTRARWVRHVVADCSPYICLFEECVDSIKQYRTVAEWVEHMRWNHTLVYQCNTPGHELLQFTSKAIFEQHLAQKHGEDFADSEVSTLIERAALPNPDFFSTLKGQQDVSQLLPDTVSVCPFCKNPMAEDDDEFPLNTMVLNERRDKLLLEHIAGHLEALALLSLPANNAGSDASGAGQTLASSNSALKGMADLPPVRYVNKSSSATPSNKSDGSLYIADHLCEGRVSTPVGLPPSLEDGAQTMTPKMYHNVESRWRETTEEIMSSKAHPLDAEDPTLLAFAETRQRINLLWKRICRPILISIRINKAKMILGSSHDPENDFRTGPIVHTPTECTHVESHYKETILSTTIAASLGLIFSLMFGPKSVEFLPAFLLRDMEATKLKFKFNNIGHDGPPWYLSASGRKSNDYSYVKPLTGAVGDKQTRCFISQALEHIDFDKAVTVLTTTKTPDVPSGAVCAAKTRYCLTWAEGNATQILVTSTIEWSGKSWLKGPVEKSSYDGQKEYAQAMVAALRAAVEKLVISVDPNVPEENKRRKELVALAHDWMSYCDKSHESCTVRELPELPMRWIDVVDMRVCDTNLLGNEEESSTWPPKRGAYAALSFVWGTHNFLKLTKAWYSSAVQMGSLDKEELPATFLDAIFLMRSLGFRRLWIDALCIVQDDMEDKDTNVAAMAAIYNNAGLLIAANGGTLPHDSLFNNLEPDFAPSHFDPSQPELGSLRTRRWAYNEVLSERVLSFGSTEMAWRCKEVTSCECTGYRPSEPESNMILIMGVAGAGKSYFINQLAGKQVVEEGTDLETCTQSCSLVPVDIGPSQILVVDVPDFDDTIRADSEILQEIARLLAAQYQLGVNLKGIIYIHRITDKRYSASALKNLEMVKKICGDAALKNVLLVTSRWAEIPEDVGLNHERELKENFWAYMIARGSNMCRFRSDRNSALSVVSQLLVKDTIVLGLQRQLVDQEKPLNETEAGSYLNDDLERLKMAYQLELASLDKKLEIFESDRAPTRQIQHDWHKEQDRLKQAQDQQQSLQRHVGSEVRGEIDSAKRRKSALGQALAFVPAAINMLGLFVGIPSIATDNL